MSRPFPPPSIFDQDLGLRRANITTRDLLKPDKIVPPSTVSGDASGLADTVVPALKLLKGLLVGNPENVANPNMSWGGSTDVPGPGGSSLTLPWGGKTQGGIDAVTAALPLFGAAEKGYFSQLAKTLEERVPNRATGEQILNIAKKGAKAEELHWSGLEDLLSVDPKRMWTRQELLDHVKTNLPELHESMVTDTTPDGKYTNDKGLTPNFTQYTLPGGENHRELVVTMPHDDDKGIDKAFDNWLGTQTLGSAIDNMDPRDADRVMRDLGTQGYQYESNITRDAFNRLPTSFQSDMKKDFMRMQQDLAPDELGDSSIPSSMYSVPSGHAYGDPELDTNRLFHMRFNDRTTSTGEKALHVDELQSDWHQAAKKIRDEEVKAQAKNIKNQMLGGAIIGDSDVKQLYKMAGEAAEKRAAALVPKDFGYNTPSELKPPPRMEVRQVTPEDIETWDTPDVKPGDWALVQDDHGLLGDEEGYQLLYSSIPHRPGMTHEQATRELHEYVSDDDVWPHVNENGVPDAPFKSTWHELGMKRAMQEAAAGGYDRLTWTTGKQQADRYSLANHVDKLEWNPYTKELIGHKNGRQVLNHHVAEEDLPATIGREAAAKLTDAEPQFTISSRPSTKTDFRSKPGYPITTQMQDNPEVHDIVNKEGKRLATYLDKEGAQVHVDSEPRTLEGDDLTVGGKGMEGFYDKMVPEFVNRYGKKWGVKAEKTTVGGKDVSELKTQLADFKQRWERSLAAWQQYNDAGQTNRADAMLAEYNTIAKKMEKLENDIKGGDPQEVWSMKITPEMRRDLMDNGQPMYAMPALKRDDNRTTRDVRMLPAHRPSIGTIPSSSLLPRP